MIAALFSLLLLGSEVAAATPAQSPTTSEAPAEDSKKICKREQVTGQLQGTKRVCLTAEQWKARQEAVARTKR